MEARKITVIETKNQRKSVIMSTAETLSELKADFRNNGIDYNDMAFFEGISKTELKSDSSVLPHDIPYKGQVTNELVFMLTNTNKKIKSGVMSRSEIYDIIKVRGLQELCKKELGKNFTMCKTIDLISVIEKYSSNKNTSNSNNTNSDKINENKSLKKEFINTDNSITKNDDYTTNNVNINSNLENAFVKLIHILENSGAIEDYEVAEIFEILREEEPNLSNEYNKTDSSYSDSEINDMFMGML